MSLIGEFLIVLCLMVVPAGAFALCVHVSSRRDATRRAWAYSIKNVTDDQLRRWPQEQLQQTRSFLRVRIALEDLSTAERVDAAFDLMRLEDAIAGTTVDR